MVTQLLNYVGVSRSGNLNFLHAHLLDPECKHMTGSASATKLSHTQMLADKDNNNKKRNPMYQEEDIV